LEVGCRSRLRHHDPIAQRMMVATSYISVSRIQSHGSRSGVSLAGESSNFVRASHAVTIPMMWRGVKQESEAQRGMCEVGVGMGGGTNDDVAGVDDLQSAQMSVHAMWRRSAHLRERHWPAISLDVCSCCAMCEYLSGFAECSS